MEIVKLKVLPTSHVGPVMPEPGAGPELTYPKGMVPYTMSCVRMAYHQGTLYADLPPATWASIDQDRAAALGYGERCAWPVNPKRAPPADLPMLKPGPVAQYLNPKADMTRMDTSATANRIDKFRALEAYYPHPEYRVWFSIPRFHARDNASGKEASMPLAHFDRMSVGELVLWLRTQLP